jgi:hypothetical protein
MGEFERLFEGATFKKGTEIDFSASGKGKLVTKIDGRAVRTWGERFSYKPCFFGPCHTLLCTLQHTNTTAHHACAITP